MRPVRNAGRDARDEIDRSGPNCGRAMYWPLSDAPVSGATVTTGYLEIAPAEGSLHETAAPSVYFQHTMVGHMCARRRVFHAWYARRPIGRHRIESMLVQEMLRPSGRSQVFHLTGTAVVARAGCRLGSRYRRIFLLEQCSDASRSALPGQCLTRSISHSMCSA